MTKYKQLKINQVLLLWALAILASCQTDGPAAIEATIVTTPLPPYLGLVKPEPGKSYTLTEYKNLAPSTGWGATDPGICAVISPIPLMEPGDFFDSGARWIRDHVQLTVDDKTLTNTPIMFLTDSLGSEGIDPQTNQTIWKEPNGAPFAICYTVRLDVGVHTAKILIDKTSGERATYTWQFRITDNTEENNE
jgi:hypothetical protein